jgi:hypothetical protein
MNKELIEAVIDLVITAWQNAGGLDARPILDAADQLRSLADAAPKQEQWPSNCNKRLQADGESYPRTCAKCGLGPCRDVVESAAREKRPKAVWRLTHNNLTGINLNRVEREQITDYILALERSK